MARVGPDMAVHGGSVGGTGGGGGTCINCGFRQQENRDKTQQQTDERESPHCDVKGGGESPTCVYGTRLFKSDAVVYRLVPAGLSLEK